MKLIFKDDFTQTRTETQIQVYDNLVTKGLITIEQAAAEMNMTVKEFKEAVEKIQSTAVSA